MKRSRPMKRTGSLKRTAFRSSVPAQAQRADRSTEFTRFVPRPRAQPDPSVTPATTPTAPTAKRLYVRNKRLREAYRLLPCQFTNNDGSLCAAEDGTVCCAHLNNAWAGKGGAIKASDDLAASGCFTHHTMLDQGGTWSSEQKDAQALSAHVRSVRLLVEQGWWPKAVPVPPSAGMPASPPDVAAGRTG